MNNLQRLQNENDNLRAHIAADALELARLHTALHEIAANITARAFDDTQRSAWLRLQSSGNDYTRWVAGAVVYGVKAGELC